MEAVIFTCVVFLTIFMLAKSLGELWLYNKLLKSQTKTISNIPTKRVKALGKRDKTVPKVRDDYYAWKKENNVLN